MVAQANEEEIISVGNEVATLEIQLEQMQQQLETLQRRKPERVIVEKDSDPLAEIREKLKGIERVQVKGDPNG